MDTLSVACRSTETSCHHVIPTVRTLTVTVTRQPFAGQNTKELHPTCRHVTPEPVQHRVQTYNARAAAAATVTTISLQIYRLSIRSVVRRRGTYSVNRPRQVAASKGCPQSGIRMCSRWVEVFSNRSSEEERFLEQFWGDIISGILKG